MKGLGYRYKEAGGDRGGEVEGKKEREGMGYEMGRKRTEEGGR